ncbi:MAG: hypothetical protein NVSMB16_15500 [Acidimicrobiales bacterium]
MKTYVGPDLEVLDTLPPRAGSAHEVIRWSRSALALVLCAAFVAGVSAGRLTSHHDAELTCVVMRFPPTVNHFQIVSIFNAAASEAALNMADSDGHRASLLFATPAAAREAAAAARDVAVPQIGHTSSIRRRPWSECMAP